MTRTVPLPHLDEHVKDIAADTDAVWRGLLGKLNGDSSHRGWGRYAQLVGAEPGAASGPRPLGVGSTLPGFRVTVAEPGRELVLEGRHWFSSYALVFRLAPLGSDRTRVRAESRAVFPGPLGAVYRALLLRTGGHVRVVRHMLAAVGRHATAFPR